MGLAVVDASGGAMGLAVVDASGGAMGLAVLDASGGAMGLAVVGASGGARGLAVVDASGGAGQRLAGSAPAQLDELGGDRHRGLLWRSRTEIEPDRRAQPG